MLQKIVFQDNIYQLVRTIDLVYEGLQLDLSPDFYFDKTVDDILFLDASIQKIVKQLQSNSRMSGYPRIIQALYSCQQRYIGLLDLILQGKSSLIEQFIQLMGKFQSIRNTHQALAQEISKAIIKGDISNDSHDVVSSNELSELLNF